MAVATTRLTASRSGHPAQRRPRPVLSLLAAAGALAVMMSPLGARAGLAQEAGAQPAGTPAAGADTHVRGLDQMARELIAQARSASFTVARLVDRLDRSDVIVLTTVGFMNDGVEADTRFITVTKRVRILSLRIDRLAAPWDRMAYLGHELQHAVEVAEAADVRSDADLRALMTRIGRKRDEGRRFETDGAVRAALSVRREIGMTPTR